jgi:peptide/nickel transport system ATP-binding protein
VSFDVPRASVVALVGESGCGKSVTSLALLRLLPTPPARIESGSIRLRGQELLGLAEREMRRLRGKAISMIFQEPMTSLNPVYTVGAQIVEAIRLHEPVSRREARARAVELLRTVGIPSPHERAEAFPHQLSGGMRQRVMIAMALACEPSLLVADEPTTALDVTIQAQILDLLRRMQERSGASVLLVTHDLGVVAEFAKELVVMYAGRVVERGAVAEVFARPLHPYTRGLLRSVPPLGLARGTAGRPRRLPTIEGMVPDLAKLPAGCRFRDRCDVAEERCSREEPPLVGPAPGRLSRCFFPDRAVAS